MSELTEKIKEIRNNGSRRQAHINLACEVIKEVEALERQLKESRKLTNKFIKRTESVLESLYQDGSEEGHSEFFYRMNSKERVLHEGFLRKLKQLKLEN